MNNFWKGLLNIVVGVGVDLLMVKVVFDTWNWFVVPLGVFTITYWHMAGLYVFVSLFGVTSKKLREMNNSLIEQRSEDLFNKTVFALVTWGIAAIVHTLMVVS